LCSKFLIMGKTKELYRSKLHVRDKSHDVIVIVIPLCPYKVKMTYECYNATERFTGELLVNGKWEHTFSLFDLGHHPDTSMYVRDESVRLTRAESLIKKGISFFNILNS